MAKPIILVHGAWHAKWCWKYVTSLLEQRGHQVIAINLPGHGENRADFKNIRLSTYVNYLTNFLQSFPEPVTLVGHSLAGLSISQVAENLPERIKELIYITAYIPNNGDSLSDEVKKSSATRLSPELIIDLKGNIVDLKKSAKIKDLLYNLCAEEDINFAMNLLQTEPYRPFLEKIHLTESKFGKIKKTYIECTDDNVLPRQDQRRMSSQHRCNVVNINADHSPFFSAPYALTNAILNI